MSVTDDGPNIKIETWIGAYDIEEIGRPDLVEHIKEVAYYFNDIFIQYYYDKILDLAIEDFDTYGPPCGGGR